MTELWLVRHGQTDWNQEYRLQGQKDIPLNENGLSQAHSLAVELAGQLFDAAFTSDLLRARNTAEILIKNRAIPLRVDARLRERDFGLWEGIHYDAIAAAYPAEYAARQQDPIGYRIPAGESLNDVASRVCGAVVDIYRLHPQGRVLVVSHGQALAVLKCLALGDPLELYRNHRFENAEPVVVQWNSPGC